MDSPEREFSFKTGLTRGGEPVVAPGDAPATPETPAVPASVPQSDAGTPGLEVAYRWAKIYANDVEFEPFFRWIERRSNPERTDFHKILESIPDKWGPDDLPPPLRRFFLEKMTAHDDRRLGGF